MRRIFDKLLGRGKEAAPVIQNEVEGSHVSVEEEPLTQETTETLVDVDLTGEATATADESEPDPPEVSGVDTVASGENLLEANRQLDETQPIQSSLSDTTVALPKERATHEKDRAPLLQAIQVCHIGNVRTRNEDSVYIFTAESWGEEPLLPFGLYMVADGMGGHHAGHEASKRVSRMVAQQVLERIYLPLIKNSVSAPVAPPDPVREVMLDAVQTANVTIHSPEPDKDGGTTLTAALIFGRRLYIVHVGDSRAYLLSRDTLKQVTTDHSYVQRLQDAGQLTEEEAAIHPQRNLLYKAVGQGGELEIDTFTQTLPEKGKLLLCSDGLWGLVPEPKIKEVLEQSASLEARASELVGLALQSGGHDNISVVVVEFGF